jgi:hypothetical protein
MLSRKFLLIGVLAIVATLCTAFLKRPLAYDKFKIFFDEKLIKGKADYLADAPKDLDRIKRPNIILILADDLGATDLGIYGNKNLTTPNIDAIGHEGVTFMEGYISSPVCSPSRAGLLTGRYQQRFGHEFQPQQRYLKNMAEYYGFKMLPRFKPLTPIKELDVPSGPAAIRDHTGRAAEKIRLLYCYHRQMASRCSGFRQAMRKGF